MTDQDKINCVINGTAYTFPKGTMLLEFLKSKNLPAAAIVIEHNKKVLPKGEYEGIELADGDVLEIIQVIGGG